MVWVRSVNENSFTEQGPSNVTSGAWNPLVESVIFIQSVDEAIHESGADKFVLHVLDGDFLHQQC